MRRSKTGSTRNGQSVDRVQSSGWEGAASLPNTQASQKNTILGVIYLYLESPLDNALYSSLHTQNPTLVDFTLLKKMTVKCTCTHTRVHMLCFWKHEAKSTITQPRQKQYRVTGNIGGL